MREKWTAHSLEQLQKNWENWQMGILKRPHKCDVLSCFEKRLTQHLQGADVHKFGNGIKQNGIGLYYDVTHTAYSHPPTRVRFLLQFCLHDTGSAALPFSCVSPYVALRIGRLFVSWAPRRLGIAFEERDWENSARALRAREITRKQDMRPLEGTAPGERNEMSEKKRRNGCPAGYPSGALNKHVRPGTKTRLCALFRVTKQ